ncbi:MAG: SPOR domain-containing protein [bacterium]|nr:SPOR domain-containing protein [bacterium]
MKNFHKVQGKREFLFDDRELLVLGGGAAFICALVFILGLMVGQTLGEQSMASPMAAQEMSIATDSELGLDNSFSDGQTDFVDDTEQVADSPDEMPGMKKSEQSYFTVLPDKESYVEVKATPVRSAEPEPVPQEEAQAAPEKAAASQAAVQAPQQVAQADTPIPPSENSAVRAQSQAATSVPVLPNVPRDPSDSIQVGRQATTMNTPIIPGDTIYSVQVSSSPNQEDSERLVRKFGEQGYQAYIMQADLGDRGIWYRVRVGNLGSRAEALIVKAELEEKVPKLANSPYVIKVSE